ncbi:MAG: DUF448 domain-containing protein [Sulfurimonadaceae bacterium]
MAPNVNNPQRMCVACRGRFEQKALVRLQCKQQQLSSYNGSGRSFYLCLECVDNEKKVTRALARACKSGDIQYLSTQLKEIIIDVRQS